MLLRRHASTVAALAARGNVVGPERAVPAAAHDLAAVGAPRHPRHVPAVALLQGAGEGRGVWAGTAKEMGHLPVKGMHEPMGSSQGHSRQVVTCPPVCANRSSARRTCMVAMRCQED